MDKPKIPSALTPGVPSRRPSRLLAAYSSGTISYGDFRSRALLALAEADDFTAMAGDIAHREYFGELRFPEARYDEPIPITDQDIAYRRIWREAGQLARESDRPLHLSDLFELAGSEDPTHACYRMKRAVQAGLVRKIGWQTGWVPVD